MLPNGFISLNSFFSDTFQKRNSNNNNNNSLFIKINNNRNNSLKCNQININKTNN